MDRMKNSEGFFQENCTIKFLTRHVHREEQDVNDRQSRHDAQDKKLCNLAYHARSSREADPVFLFNKFIMQSPCSVNPVISNEPCSWVVKKYLADEEDGRLFFYGKRALFPSGN
jgi:hypothetical protein